MGDVQELAPGQGEEAVTVAELIAKLQEHPAATRVLVNTSDGSTNDVEQVVFRKAHPERWPPCDAVHIEGE